jgi:hypothetical protein
VHNSLYSYDCWLAAYANDAIRIRREADNFLPLLKIALSLFHRLRWDEAASVARVAAAAQASTLFRAKR